MVEAVEAKCARCGKGYPYSELYCMLSGRGANSNCRDHQHFLICNKCGGFDKKDLACPYCASKNISFPNRMTADGRSMIIRQCFTCLRVFWSDGTKIPRVIEYLQCDKCKEYTKCPFLDAFLKLWRKKREFQEYMPDGCNLAKSCRKFSVKQGN